MGAVYEATDRARGMDVALKTLVRMDPSSILRFKQEFRALADVSHPNLVTLYELVSTDEDWFFTMELVRGVDIVTYLRGAPVRRKPDFATLETRNLQCTDAPPNADAAGNSTALEFDRVRDVIRQLSDGVRALHERGYLHRDIKPSNILVTDEGRVVLLDFGIVSAMAQSQRSTYANELVGTPAYMAPEQADNAATTASDWYAVGGVLYHVLTGRPPFVGTMNDVIAQKQRTQPPPVSSLAEAIPPDLEGLCEELLQLEPANRPRANQVAQRLDLRLRTDSIDADTSGAIVDDAILVGRDRELAALRASFAEARSGHGAVALVHGDSGMGKSALIRTFLDDAAARGAVVLHGRCYERESVPFKAVDSLIDSLTRHLMLLSRTEADEVVPRDVQLLSRLFPVLNRVDAVAVPRVRSFASPDPHESRARAFEALRQMLTAIASRAPLVLFIDDLQWGDEDSAHLLDSLLRKPGMPPMLLVGSYRTANAEHSPLLRELLPRLAGEPGVVSVPLTALSPGRSTELARALLERAAAPLHQAEPIARESAGHPYFIHELVRYHAENAHVEDGALSLDAVIGQRVSSHQDTAQTAMRALAVAGRPMRRDSLRAATRLERGQLSSALLALGSAQLIRTTGADDHDLVECYHDRIRETVVRGLDATSLAQLHRAIANALRIRDDADAETLAEHFEACGETGLAARHLSDAADRANAALSFLHAARLYQRALELGDYADVERRSLYERTGDALTSAGRLADAAEFYDQAAALTDGVAATRLRLKAGQGVLWNGQLDAGKARLDGVLRELDLRLHSSPTRAIGGLLVGRARLRLRGLRYRQRDPGEVAERDRLRVDACWSVGLGLSQIEPARAGVFAATGLIHALRIGDPFRIIRALSLEAGFLASAGEPGRKRALQLVELAESIAASTADDPVHRALIYQSRGFIAFETGRFREGLEHCSAAEQTYRDHCTGKALEVSTAQFFLLSSLLLMGDFGELDRLTHPWLAAMQERGDYYQATNIRTLILPAVYLRRADPQAALAETEAALADWGEQGFHNPTLNALVMKVMAHLYTGEARSALSLIHKYESGYRGSLLKHVQIIRSWWTISRGMSSVAVAALGEADAAACLKTARRDARSLRREKATWCVGLSHLLAAGIANVEGDKEKAVEQLRAAAALLDEADMALHAAAARYRLGHLLGGDEGAELIALAVDSMAALGFTDYPRSVSSLAPGYRD